MKMSYMLSQKGLLRVTIIVSKQIMILKCSSLLTKKSHRCQTHLKMTTSSTPDAKINLFWIKFSFLILTSSDISHITWKSYHVTTQKCIKWLAMRKVWILISIQSLSMLTFIHFSISQLLSNVHCSIQLLSRRCCGKMKNAVWL